MTSRSETAATANTGSSAKLMREIFRAFTSKFMAANGTDCSIIYIFTASSNVFDSDKNESTGGGSTTRL